MHAPVLISLSSCILVGHQKNYLGPRARTQLYAPPQGDGLLCAGLKGPPGCISLKPATTRVDACCQPVCQPRRRWIPQGCCVLACHAVHVGQTPPARYVIWQLRALQRCKQKAMSKTLAGGMGSALGQLDQCTLCASPNAALVQLCQVAPYALQRGDVTDDLAPVGDVGDSPAALCHPATLFIGSRGDLYGMSRIHSHLWHAGKQLQVSRCVPDTPGTAEGVLCGILEVVGNSMSGSNMRLCWDVAAGHMRPASEHLALHATWEDLTRCEWCELHVLMRHHLQSLRHATGNAHAHTQASEKD